MANLKKMHAAASSFGKRCSAQDSFGIKEHSDVAEMCRIYTYVLVYICLNLFKLYIYIYIYIYIDRYVLYLYAMDASEVRI